MVSIVRCPGYNRDEVLLAVKRCIDLLGGISAFVKVGDRVLVKPNLLFARIPEEGVTTHPELVRAVVRLLKEAGASVLVGDSPSGCIAERWEDVYRITGIKQVCQEERVDLVKFAQVSWIGEFPLASCARECDAVVSIPKFKTHNLTVLTGAIKNLFGLIPGLYKMEFHRRHPRPEELAKVLVEIFSLAKPCLNIVDGILAMEGEGPSAGSLRNVGLIFGSKDAVALDSVLAAVMGIKPLDILTTKQAYTRGLGQADLDKIDIAGEALEEVRISDFKLPKASILSRIPPSVLKAGRPLVRFKLYVDRNRCRGCGFCQKSCPQGAIRLEEGRINIDHPKCILCLCCQEICPEGAIQVKRSLLAKLANL